jgi:hypothetical protein
MQYGGTSIPHSYMHLLPLLSFISSSPKKINHIPTYQIGRRVPQNVIFLHQSFRIRGPEPQYSQNDHVGEKEVKLT